MPPFYPNPVFGWTFYAVLLGFLAIATYIDIGRLKIPRTLTLTMLALGVVFSVVRGAWMGSVLDGSDHNVWLFANSPVLGALDGLLCSVAGFAVGFVLFTALWFLGVMGGGDVKLMAALGAWLGPVQMMFVVFVSVVVLLVLGVFLLLRKLFTRGVQKTAFGMRQGAQGTNLKKTKAGMQRRDRVLAYSLPVAIAAGLLLPFFVFKDTQRLPPVKSPSGDQTASVGK